MIFYFCRTPPFVWHSLLRRLAKTGRLHTLGLIRLVHTLDIRGIVSRPVLASFILFSIHSIHLCLSWFDWYGVFVLLGATVFVFALTLLQIS